MLNLQSESSSRWLDQVESHLDEILVDHAHCERKAAGTALNLLFSYVENEALCREMTEIVNEELEHFQQVLDLLKERGIPFRRLKPANYAGQLKDLVRKNEPQRAVDRLLVASLIEARSCNVLISYVAMSATSNWPTFTTACLNPRHVIIAPTYDWQKTTNHPRSFAND